MPEYSSSPNCSFPDIHHSHLKNYICCLITRPSSFIYISFAITNISLLLPLCIFILHRGVKQWLQKRSSASISHSDYFTYHMAVFELIGVLSNVLVCCGIDNEAANVILMGDSVFCVIISGQLFLHILTCVERYLAVVYPVTYLSLRSEKWIRIRNVCIGCVWLLCFTLILPVVIEKFYIVELCLLSLSITIVSFCSLSVLRVLIRPGPGEQGGGRERADQLKQRAFYTMVTILSLLVVRLSWGLALSVLHALMRKKNCVVAVIEGWIYFPSSLVLPLLFLHRDGKLLCCRKNFH